MEIKKLARPIAFSANTINTFLPSQRGADQRTDSHEKKKISTLPSGARAIMSSRAPELNIYNPFHPTGPFLAPKLIILIP